MYFIFYLIFPFYVLCFILCKLYLLSFWLSFVFGDRDYIIIDSYEYNPFSFLFVFLGYGIIIILVNRDHCYHRTGIYLFLFFFVCVFLGSYNVCDYIILILLINVFGMRILLLSLKYDEL